MRYFFDVVGPSRSEHDSFGTLLPDREEAQKWAQLLIVVLQNASDKQALEGGRIRVRDGNGSELFSIPICPPDENLERSAVGRTELGDDRMKSLVVKRSIMIGERKSSVSLEEAFWKGLKEIASNCRITLSELVADIDSRRQHSNLSSAIRLFVLDHYRTKIATAWNGRATIDKETQVPLTGEDCPQGPKPF